MKKQLASIILIACFLIIPISKSTVNAQLVKAIPEKRTFLGLGVGVNDYGLGGGIEFPLMPSLYAYGNVGLGGWGYKIGGGLTFYPKRRPYGIGISAGYSLATGAKDIETELYIEPYDEPYTVILDLNHASTVNLMLSQNWKLGRVGKLVLSLGYAVPLEIEPYEVKNNGVVLNEESKMVLQIMQPGGLILGVKFMFGLR